MWPFPFYLLLISSLSSAASIPSLAGRTVRLARFDTLWDQAHCTTSEIGDVSLSPTNRWDSVDTEGAWKAAIDDWKNKRDDIALTFSQQLCDDLIHPGGYLILNSFRTISSLHWNIYDAIDKAAGPIDNDIGSFTSTFAPIDEKNKDLDLILDVAGLGFALFAFPVWNSALRQVPFFKVDPNYLDTLKDAVDPAVAYGLQIAGDIAKDDTRSNARITVQNNLNSNLGGLVRTWWDTMDGMNKQLFDGSDESINRLHEQITGGQGLDPGFGADEPLVQ